MIHTSSSSSSYFAHWIFSSLKDWDGLHNWSYRMWMVFSLRFHCPARTRKLQPVHRHEKSFSCWWQVLLENIAIHRRLSGCTNSIESPESLILCNETGIDSSFKPNKSESKMRDLIPRKRLLTSKRLPGEQNLFHLLLALKAGFDAVVGAPISFFVAGFKDGAILEPALQLQPTLEL